ncbi:MAG: FAD:protein FMN transferase [Duncaniella sp.]|nr:FAD:protein FMN transferase [Duncaniella sp.]
MHSLFKHIAYSLVLLTLIGCSRPAPYLTADGGVWNTTYHIIYQSDIQLDDSIRTVMKQVEMSLSPFNKNSLISKINRGDSMPVDSLLRRVFLASQDVNRHSNGTFDPTVAPLINLWGFGYKETGVKPTQEAIDSILSLVGIAECEIDSIGYIIKKSENTEFNFSAITKGYGCDLVGEMLRRNGCRNFMVEIGGEIALDGVNPRGGKWRIMVDAPIDNDTAVVHERMAVIELDKGGVATSGNYRNYRMTPEGRVWHTINPVNGIPAHTDLLSATVVAPSAMLADAFATSCMAVQCSEAMEMLNKVDGVEALLVTADTIIITSGFPEIYQ